MTWISWWWGENSLERSMRSHQLAIPWTPLGLPSATGTYRICVEVTGKKRTCAVFEMWMHLTVRYHATKTTRVVLLQSYFE